jgi:hypothetical protein
MSLREELNINNGLGDYLLDRIEEVYLLDRIEEKFNPRRLRKGNNERCCMMVRALLLDMRTKSWVETADGWGLAGSNE